MELVGAILVVSLILSELFLPSGDTRTFNKAVRLIQENEHAQRALVFPQGERLKAYGIVAADRWVRNRPVQSVKTKHKDGKDHLLMKFQVESDSGIMVLLLWNKSIIPCGVPSLSILP